MLITENMNKDHKYTTDPAQPKFHKYKIETPAVTVSVCLAFLILHSALTITQKYYGFNFVEDHECKSFEREVRLALLKGRSDPCFLTLLIGSRS